MMAMTRSINPMIVTPDGYYRHENAEVIISESELKSMQKEIEDRKKQVSKLVNIEINLTTRCVALEKENGKLKEKNEKLNEFDRSDILDLSKD